jgi:hypothetical protein
MGFEPGVDIAADDYREARLLDHVLKIFQPRCPTAVEFAEGGRLLRNKSVRDGVALPAAAHGRKSCEHPRAAQGPGDFAEARGIVQQKEEYRDAKIGGECRQDIQELIAPDGDEIVAIGGIQVLNDRRWRGRFGTVRQFAEDQAMDTNLLETGAAGEQGDIISGLYQARRRRSLALRRRRPGFL